MPQPFLTHDRNAVAPHLVKSILIHAVAFVLISFFVLQEVRVVRLQEKALLEDIRAKEQEAEEAERIAREEAAKEMFREQLQFEFDELLSNELEEKDNEELKQTTEEDLDSHIEEVEDNWAEMTQLQLDELLSTIRFASFEQLRLNLEALQKDLLIAQVRAYVRERVAPDIRQKIERELKHHLGEGIKRKVQQELAKEKKTRATELAKELQERAGELKELQRDQDSIRRELDRRPPKELSAEEQKALEREAQIAEQTRKTLDQVARKLPQSAAQAENTKALFEDDAAAKSMQAAKQAMDADKKDQAKTESSRGSKELAKQAAALEGLAGHVQRVGNDTRPDEIQKALAEEAADKAEGEVRKQIEDKVKTEAVPAAADKIAKALEPELKRLRLDSDKFRENVGKDIENALEEALEENRPEAPVALLKARHEYKVMDPEALEAARKKVLEAIRGLEELKTEEEVLKEKASAENLSHVSVHQTGLAGAIGESRRQSKDALRNAQTVTLKSDRLIDQVYREVSRRDAEKAATEAAEVARRGLAKEAKAQMDRVVENLGRSIGQLKRVEQALAEEAEELRSLGDMRLRLADMLGEDGAEEAVEAIQEAIEGAAEEGASESLERAVKALRAGNILANAEDAERLGKTGALRNRLDQVAKNIEEGRDMAATASVPIPGPPIPGAGVGPPGYLGSGGSVRGRLVFDREAYEEFIKDLKNRINPNNYYSSQDEVDGLKSSAGDVPEKVPSKVFVDAAVGDKDAEEPEPADREVPEPQFTYKAFAAASMVDSPIRIDGDLSDWGELRHPIKMQYIGDNVERVEGLPTLYMRWSPDGLYFCYKTKDTNGLQPCPQNAYDGDALEVWVDMVNSRIRRMEVASTAHQFCFMPFGYRGDKSCTFAEIGRGMRGLKMYHTYADAKGIRGSSAGRMIPGYGYQVEGFLRRRALSRPILAPGRYIAVQFSVNVGFGRPNNYLWAASKGIMTWNKPDTWGDVLLLGSDARSEFVSFEDTSKSLEGLAPGQPLAFQIMDRDMDLNTYRPDRIAAELRVKSVPGSMFVVLRETDKSTGVFTGSVSTQQYFLPQKKDTLNVRSGDTVQLVYRDARCEFGEKDRVVTEEIKVGWPVMKVGQLRANAN